MPFSKKKILVWMIILALVLLWGAVDIGLKPWIFIKGIPNIVHLLAEMFPPDFRELPRYLASMVKTIQIGLVGTALAIILSIFLGVLAARNITPAWFFYVVSRGILDFNRSISDIVLVLIFIIAVGFGPFSGVMALALSSSGLLGKLYADTIEAIDIKSVEAIQATGASRIQTILFAVIPQVLPTSIANTLFIADRNIRMAVVLGVVGAGGIGHDLMVHMRLFHYPQAAAMILIIFITIWLLGFLSDSLRKKII